MLRQWGAKKNQLRGGRKRRVNPEKISLIRKTECRITSVPGMGDWFGTGRGEGRWGAKVHGEGGNCIHSSKEEGKTPLKKLSAPI